MLVPEDLAQEKKGLRSLADSGVHLNSCATVLLHKADNVLDIGLLFYSVIARKYIDLHRHWIEV